MKITVLDGKALNPGDLKWDEISREGEFTLFDYTSKDEVVDRIGESEIVITNKTVIDKEVMDACPSIRYICVLATGYNIVDTAYAEKKGILVSNVPSYARDSVSQYTMALLLELCHHIGHHDREVKKGRWKDTWCFWDYPLLELKGKTMGIIGMGAIGERTAELASAFGMEVICYSRTVKEGWRNVSLPSLFALSDVISLHCPLTDVTKGIIRKENIEKMKDGVFIINTGRGGLVVEEDLKEALESGKVGGAAVDVVSTEPIKEDNPLLSAPNCIITPHMAWGSREARERIISITAENIRAYKGGAPINLVK